MSATLLVHDSIVKIVVELRPPQLCLSIRGELDMSSSGHLGAVGRLDLTDVDDVLIDLTELSFCDLTGLRAIALLHDSQRLERRTVRLVQPPRCVARLAEIVGRGDLLPRPDLRMVPGESSEERTFSDVAHLRPPHHDVRTDRRAALRTSTTEQRAAARRNAEGER